MYQQNTPCYSLWVVQHHNRLRAAPPADAHALENASFVAEETWSGLRICYRRTVRIVGQSGSGLADNSSVCAMSIVRQAILYHNNASGSKETDATWTEIPNYIWL